MNKVDFRVLENFVKLLVSSCNAESIADKIQIGFVASTNGQNICVGVGLVDRNEFGSETEADHGDVNLFLGH